ncbi:pyridoxamine 5'-phosphate oxidase family protein [Halorussus sp. AFM4]|uniref:pyridoxamine 5'-phosphate oxidase family protein n=1 Tax=Halorussus sp. AFM4 TaxID=3421651 RepID=UPI003EC0A3F6
MDVSNTDGRELRGEPMDEAAVDAFLHERGVGVLSLADGGDAYGCPVSFGYDGEQLYFVLLRFGEDSEKLDFAAATETATFAAYDFEDEHRWRSVLVRGPIEPVPEDRTEAVDEALFDNAQFASLYPQGEPMTERTRYRLVPEEVTGQQGQGRTL